MFNLLPEAFSISDAISKPLIFASSIIIGVGGAIVIVSLLIRYNDVETCSSSESDSNSKSVSDSDSDSDFNKKYEEKYLEKYKRLENNDIRDNDIDDSNIKYIEDLTPSGIVKMTYHKRNRHFLFYCNKKDIPYKYLETVARLYVIEQDCKNIYIDYEEELKKLFDRMGNNTDGEKKDGGEKNTDGGKNTDDGEKNTDGEKKDGGEKNTDGEKKDDGVFAKLKNYKMDKSATTKKNWIIPERMNQYKYKGTMRDYNEDIEVKTNNELINDEFEHLDYSTFKKLKRSEKKTSL